MFSDAADDAILHLHCVAYTENCHSVKRLKKPATSHTACQPARIVTDLSL